MYPEPLHWNLGHAWICCVLVGLMLLAAGFFVEFAASRLNRRLREGMGAMHERYRHLDDIAFDRATKPNACASAMAGRMTAKDGSRDLSGSMA